MGWGGGQDRPPFIRTHTHIHTHTGQLTIQHYGMYDLSHTHTVASKNSLTAVSLPPSSPSGRDAVLSPPVPPGSCGPLETAENNTRRTRPLRSVANDIVKLIGLRRCECVCLCLLRV